MKDEMTIPRYEVHVCKMSIVQEDGSMKVMGCQEVREKQEEMLADFRKANGTDKLLEMGMQDKVYAKYILEIRSFINQCKCPKLLYDPRIKKMGEP